MNQNELKAEMRRNGDTQEKLAEALDLSLSGVNNRVNGRVEFRRSEINIIRHRYHLSAEDTIRIFFEDGVSC